MGPRIIPEVKCNGCGHRYNGHTGGTNTTAIAIYLTVACTIIFGMLALGVIAILTHR